MITTLILPGHHTTRTRHHTVPAPVKQAAPRGRMEPRAASPSQQHGLLVDRLMARIGELEQRLQPTAAEEPAAAADGDHASFTIPAVYPQPPSPRTAAADAAAKLAEGGRVDASLLQSLGDPDNPQQLQRQQHLQEQEQEGGGSGRDWLAAMPSWIARSSLARAALASSGGADDCAADPPAASGGSQTAAASAAADQEPLPPLWAVPPGDGRRGSSTTATKAHQLRQSAAASSADAAPSQSTSRWGSGLRSVYNRYVLTSAPGGADEQRSERGQRRDDDADGGDGSLLQRVHEAAGAALAEANERLMDAELHVQAAQAAQADTAQRLAAAEACMEALKSDNLDAWREKNALELELASARANLDGARSQAASMQQELQDLRQQASVRADSSNSEGARLATELELLSGQLLARSQEAQGLRQELTSVQAERERELQERQQALQERDRALAQLQQVGSLQQQLAAADAAAAAAASSAAEFQERFMRERAVRRRLHEQLQVLRGNIRVLCRVRPPLLPPAGAAAGAGAQHPPPPASASGAAGRQSAASCITFPLEGALAVADAATGRGCREFEFDAVFTPAASQEQVFDEVAPLVRSCADGYNCCILAYGQTGSGKTFTMEGPPGAPGINSRALQELFRIAADEGGADAAPRGAAAARPAGGGAPTSSSSSSSSSWAFSVAMLEIYNKAVRDLLAPLSTHSSSHNHSSSSSPLAAFGGPGSPPAAQHIASLDVSGLPAGELPLHMDRVPGLTWRAVADADAVAAVLREGWMKRATAATALNATSSRSHALLVVKVCGVRDRQPFTSLLHLVDLAGSERVDRSEVCGQQLKEAQAINKSLSALGDVIAALQRRSPHIPFRNSKLTAVLQDSLCGSSKVLLVCNVAPEPASCAETLSSLAFASRAAQVELGQARRGPAAAAAAKEPPPQQRGDAGGVCTPAAEPAQGGVGVEGGSCSAGSSAAATARHAHQPSALPAALSRPGSPVAGGGGGTPSSPQRGSSASSSGAGAPPGSPPLSNGARPMSRLSERVSTGAFGGGSPRTSSGAAKPARH